MQRMIKNISLILIMTVTATFSLAGFTTVKAASSIDLHYLLYIKETDSLYVSTHPWHVYNVVKKSDNTTGKVISAGRVYQYKNGAVNVVNQESVFTFSNIYFDSDVQSFVGGDYTGITSSYGSVTNLSYYFVYPYTSGSDYRYALTELIYNHELADEPWNGNISKYTVITNSEWEQEEIDCVKWYSNDLSEIGVIKNLSEKEILTLINKSINSTTATTNEAQQIQITISNSYTSYQNGDISQEEMQQIISNALSQLNELNENEDNTLADLIAINNALTYAQTVQEELLLRPSSTIITNVQTILQNVTTLVQQYQNSEVPQGQAMQELRGYINQLTQLLNGNPSVSDIEVINTAINTVNNFIEVISNSTELDPEVSSKSQKSDDEEIDYLNSLETTSSIEDLSPSEQMKSKASGIQPLLTVVWDNELIKIILPLAAGFLVISVALGRKFKL